MSLAFEGPAPDRRTLLKSAALGLFAFQIAGCERLLSAKDAREQGASLKILSGEEASLLEAFGEALVPGAQTAGIAHFVDANLARPLGDSLLTVRYLDVLPPHDAFYKAGLKALDAAAISLSGKPFARLPQGAMKQLVGSMLPGKVAGWNGPPSALFYLAVRSDAADLVYGTAAAFERMKVPYMPHIEPPADW